MASGPRWCTTTARPAPSTARPPIASTSTTGCPCAVLDPALVAGFERDGFVVVPDLLTADELGVFGAAVSDAVASRKAHDTRALAEKSRYEQSFLQCQNLWEDFPSVRPLTFHPRVAWAAASLLGVAA